MSSEELFNLQILAERAVKEKIEKMKGMISQKLHHFCSYFIIAAIVEGTGTFILGDFSLSLLSGF